MKQNYRQAKRQKELARKARQQEKHQKRVTRVDGEPDPAPGTGEGGAESSTSDPAAVRPPGGSDGTGAS